MAVDTCVFADGESPPQQLLHTQMIQGAKWIVGYGKLPCDILFIGDCPGLDELTFHVAFQSADCKAIFDMAKAAGVSMESIYMTNVVKFVPRGNKPSANDVKVCMPALLDEIARSQAKVIVPLGAKALAAVMGKGYTPTTYHGTLLEKPELPGIKIFPMFHPSYLKHNPNAASMLAKDWEELGALVGGKAANRPKTDYIVVREPFQLEAFKEFLFADYKDPVLVIDCEWDGEHGLDPTGWLRTMQIGYDYGRALIVELFDETGRPVGDTAAMLKIYKSIVEDPRVRLVGHHLRADGMWLYFSGIRMLGEPIDLRPQTYFDTMVAEHVLNESGPFGLEALTVKYTELGRYDLALATWVNAHKKETEKGYGAVPSELLLPYAAIDVDAPRYIMDKQLPLLRDAGFMAPRGQYPSLWDASMFASVALYELEIEGLHVDKHRLNQIITMYQNARNKLESKILPMAAALGYPDFNFRSWQQRGKLLFQTLNLQPIESTTGIPWPKVQLMTPQARELMMPSTDKTTMDILADIEGVHPIVSLLRDMSKVDYVCRQWLVEEEEAADFNTQERGGGLMAKIWPDGALHARFSQLKETARFGSSRPNVQNWLKKAEGELKRIVGKEGVEEVFGPGFKFPTLRSAIVPPEGYVLIEADWKQAELFVLASLSGDKNMLDALTTPGKDMHDVTTQDAFKIVMHAPDNRAVSINEMVEMAKADPNWNKDKKAAESPYQQFLSSLIYEDQRGRRLTRKQFKDGPRVGGKAVNFGVAYGRGALAIAMQVKAETGTDRLIPELKDEIAEVLDAWKTVTYPQAWAFLVDRSNAAINPPYYNQNPWGRRRRFAAVEDELQQRAFGRESANFSIQSTVADTCLIAFWLLHKYRKANNLHFKIVNQIHDALLFLVPIAETEATKKAIYETMGNIEIPIPNGPPLKLEVDIDVMKRWGEKE